jgi:beta-phosphoglucomutase-like phosphatase (HAD superfamily)
MGVSANQCLAFEDSENGLRAARECGLQTVITVSQYNQGQDFSGAALVLDQLGEPGHPFKVLSGEAGDHQFVTVEQLRALHAQVV